MPTLRHLPAAFEIGVSSSAFGIEGAVDVDGRTTSIWDATAGIAGRTADDSTGAIAVDHYHRQREDVSLLAELGVDAYRFSISWSRVQPAGRGAPNPRGLDFYERLVDRLLAADIDPWVTLYHWDLPVELMFRGGWLDRDTADALGDMAELVSNRLGDRVKRWTTMADPLLHMAYGHALGIDAPGLTLLGGAFPVTHHLLLGHARVREVLSADSSALIGIANQHTAVRPAGHTMADRMAARLYDAYYNRQFAEPILAGRYPRLLQPLIDAQPEVVRPGDLIGISAPLDFYGVNYFHPTVVAAAPENATIPFAVVDLPGAPLTDYDWPVHPESLTEVLVDLHRRYLRLPPLFVTENGAAYADVPEPDLADSELPVYLPDQARIDYLIGHLVAIDDAAAAGVDVRGYFHRGLTDAWEGSEGFTRQFGLVRVEPTSLDRTRRASFYYLRQLISERSSTRGEPQRPDEFGMQTRPGEQPSGRGPGQ